MVLHIFTIVAFSDKKLHRYVVWDLCTVERFKKMPRLFQNWWFRNFLDRGIYYMSNYAFVLDWFITWRQKMSILPKFASRRLSPISARPNRTGSSIRSRSWYLTKKLVGPKTSWVKPQQSLLDRSFFLELTNGANSTTPKWWNNKSWFYTGCHQVKSRERNKVGLEFVHIDVQLTVQFPLEFWGKKKENE